MVTAAQKKARELFTQRAKAGIFRKSGYREESVFSAAKIRGAGVTVKQFIANLRKKGYTAKKRPDGSVEVNLKR